MTNPDGDLSLKRWANLNGDEMGTGWDGATMMGILYSLLFFFSSLFFFLITIPPQAGVFEKD